MIEILRIADKGEVFRFVAVGAASAGFYALVLTLLSSAVAPALASVPSYLAAMFVNYGLQRGWTFRSDKPHRQAAPRYIATHIGGILINAAILYFLNDLYGLPLVPVQIGALGVLTVWSYLMQKLWTFREPNAD